MNLKGRDLLSIKDLSKEEIIYLLDLAKELKLKKKKNIPVETLRGRNAAFVFERPGMFVKAAADGSIIRRTIDCAHCEPLNVLVNQGFPALLLLAGAMFLTLVRSVRRDSDASVALHSALAAYLAASLFGIGMPANDAFSWLIWGSLLRETAKENGNH